MDGPATRSQGQYSAQQHYEVEVELADRLRGASRQERLSGLYSSVYAERLARIPAHPLLVRSQDPVEREQAVRVQVRLLLPFLAPNTAFMEVGPGDCWLALAVAARVKTVYAVDVTDSLVGSFQFPSNFHFVASDGVTIGLPPETIDLAYSNQVLEHLHPDDANEHVRAVHRTLAPGGKFICVTPNRLSGPWDISRHFGETANGLHLKEYTVWELVDLLRASGFTVNLIATYHGRHLLPHVPEGLVRRLEKALEGLPPGVRRPAAMCLTAVKVVATKPAAGNARSSSGQRSST
jgi:SAM-dependent methyltransferase